MLRVKTASLVCQEKRFFFQDQLFSGLGFQVINGVVEKVAEYLNGVEVRDYRSEYIDYNESRICIDRSFLDGEEYEDEEPFLYNKKRFSGLAYDFDGDFCVGELLFENGVGCTNVSFFHSGELAGYEESGKEIYQCFEWYKNRKLKHIDFSWLNKFMVEFNFDDQERIRTAMIPGDYFESVYRFRSQLKFHLFETKTYAAKLFAAPYFYLSGEGVDDELFNYLQSYDGFRSLAKISIDNTSLTSHCIANLKRESNLKEILIEDEKQDLKEIAKALKNERPDCLIRLTQESNSFILLSKYIVR
ncbi:MAG: hypothetical protein DRR16_30760 [Candidatus Parabeggiatoa sp. nov. 3]|jgi:hypothetical protein|nr:MAG: hypothetical protein DRR00_32325 [Gammaproteobacteria bacterium]RKZ76022.1 MAG: hypothetical protein DRR16_30760 [Gammaproteobacteria bacterium]